MEVSDFWLFIELSILEWFLTWFSNMQKFPYVRIFKLQLISVKVLGRFLQYEFFFVVVIIMI